ncbi:MAG: hypothetical protein ACFFD4_19160 [Candidatus Odinarchaeota archaeon]
MRSGAKRSESWGMKGKIDLLELSPDTRLAKAFVLTSPSSTSPPWSVQESGDGPRSTGVSRKKQSFL